MNMLNLVSFLMIIVIISMLIPKICQNAIVMKNIALTIGLVLLLALYGRYEHIVGEFGLFVLGLVAGMIIAAMWRNGGRTMANKAKTGTTNFFGKVKSFRKKEATKPETTKTDESATTTTKVAEAEPAVI